MTLPGSLPVTRLAAGTGLWRIHRRVHAPVWFGPAPGRPAAFRFDAPRGEYRVCYLGDSLAAAFVETLIRGSGTRVVALHDLRARQATSVPLSRELRLARLHSDGLVHLALPADVPHLHPYDRCQRLALELWRHADAVDGIEYRSRWDDSLLCVALFDRGGSALGAPGPSLPLDDYRTIRPVLERYDVRVA